MKSYPCLEIDASPHGVNDGIGLLEDLLLHEEIVVALHDLLQLHLQGGDLALVRVVASASDPVDAERAVFDRGNVVILKNHNVNTVTCQEA